VMLIARTSCAKLPLSSEPSVADQLDKRQKACDRVVFQPKPRPVAIVERSSGAPPPAAPQPPQGAGNDPH